MSSSYKSVFFDSLEVLEFPQIIGDSPAVSGGCPVALDLELVERTTYEVDQFEMLRGKRRNGKKLMLSVPARAKM
jgi:hypothetical protein